MSASRTLQRAHVELSGEERFRAAVLALARDDRRELRRLIDSCPTAVYRLPEAAFLERWEGWRTLTVAATWLGMTLRLDAQRAAMAEQCTEQVAGWTVDMVEHAAWRLAREHGVEFDDSDLDELRRTACERVEKMVSVLRDGTTAALARVAAWDAALETLAGELAVPPTAVRAALGEPPAADGLPDPDGEFYDALLDMRHRFLG